MSPAVPVRVPKEVPSAAIDRAVQFYLEHYVIGLPDEAKVGQDLQNERWVFAPTTRQVMAAVGFASLANISGNGDTMIMARQQYGVALRETALSLMNPQSLDIAVAMRAVAMLGMFEVRLSQIGPEISTFCQADRISRSSGAMTSLPRGHRLTSWGVPR